MLSPVERSIRVSPLSRLAFHHFADIDKPFYEMKRVLKPHGKLVLIDMIADDEINRATRDEIEKYCDDNNIEYCTDSTNLQNEYTRNKIRNILLPWLSENINPAAGMNMANASELLREEEEYLESKAQEQYKKLLKTAATVL